MRQLCSQGGCPPDGMFASLPGRRAPRRIVTCRGLVDAWAVRVRRPARPSAELVEARVVLSACPGQTGTVPCAV